MRQSYAQRRQLGIEERPVNAGPLGFADGTLARIRIQRGNGRIEVAGVLLTPHSDRRFLVTHREGGGTYSTNAEVCNCEAGLHGKRCCHMVAVQASGGVEAVYNAMDWWKDTEDERRAG